MSLTEPNCSFYAMRALSALFQPKCLPNPAIAFPCVHISLTTGVSPFPGLAFLIVSNNRFDEIVLLTIVIVTGHQNDYELLAME